MEEGGNMKKLLIITLITFLSMSTICSSQSLIPSERKIQWNPGIPGGIPHRTMVCANVKDPPYNAKGDGVTDDADAIQKAIDDCPPNHVVYIPEGRYYLSHQITLTKSNITLRGAGPDKTLLFFGDVWRGFLVGSGTISGNYIDVVSGAHKDSDTITLSDASTINAGDYLIIDQENDPDYANSNGHEGKCTWCGLGRCSHDHNLYCPSWDNGKTDVCNEQGVCEGGNRTTGFIIKVTSKSGNTITLEPRLYWEFKSQFDPQVIKLEGVDEYIGLEDFYVTTKDKTGGYTFEMGYCAYCWFKNIESSSSNQRHVWAYALYRNEFRDCFFHDVTCYIGNYGYGLSLQGHVTATLLENNIFYSLGSPISFSAGGGGNVVAYNYVGNGIKEHPVCGKYNHITPSGISIHGAHPIYNLFEGNVMNAFSSDFIWGSSSHGTIFRNRFIGYQPDSVKQMRAISLGKYSRYYNIIGNILGTDEVNFTYEIEGVDNDYCWYYPTIYFLCYKDGDTCLTEQCDPLVKQTLIRHGNYDFANRDIIWNSSMSHTIPDSLYLTQRPSWWDPTLQWPPFGPDSSPEDKIPAQLRFESLGWPSCGNGKKERKKTRIVIDNSDPECTIIGSWDFMENKPYAFKNNYLRDGSSDSDPDKAVIFRLDVPENYYDVYFVWKRAWWLDAEDVPVTVIHDNGVYNTTVNQTENLDPEGKYLGTFKLSGSSMIIINASSPGYTTVDAIRLINNYTEECDDGNTINGDGCSSDCKIEETSCHPGDSFIWLNSTYIQACSCNQSDVQAAIDAAKDGDTVLVPEGRCEWVTPGNNPAISIYEKSILLQGAGAGKSNITLVSTGNGVMEVPIVISSKKGKPVRITGFSFTGFGNTYDHGVIKAHTLWNNTVGGDTIRIDHCDFYNITHVEIRIGSKIYGVIDNCNFTEYSWKVVISVSGDNYKPWESPLTLGTANALYVEDCIFKINGNGGAINSYSGGKYVFRHNKVIDGAVDNHGTCHGYQGDRRSAHTTEIYENSFYSDIPYFFTAISIHGGTGVIFNNVLTGDFKHKILVGNYRTCTSDECFYGRCNGSSPYDGNLDASGYPCLDQVGRTSDQDGNGIQDLVPLYEWNNTYNGVDCNISINDHGCTNPDVFQHIKKNRDFYDDTVEYNPETGYYESTYTDDDGTTKEWRYKPYIYPHPLTVAPFGTKICGEGQITEQCWCQGLKNSGYCCHGYYKTEPCYSSSCTIHADLPPCDGKVTLQELLVFVNKWKLNRVSIKDIIEAIKMWKNG